MSVPDKVSFEMRRNSGNYNHPPVLITRWPGSDNSTAPQCEVYTVPTVDAKIKEIKERADKDRKDIADINENIHNFNPNYRVYPLGKAGTLVGELQRVDIKINDTAKHASEDTEKLKDELQKVKADIVATIQKVLVDEIKQELTKNIFENLTKQFSQTYEGEFAKLNERVDKQNKEIEELKSKIAELEAQSLRPSHSADGVTGVASPTSLSLAAATPSAALSIQSDGEKKDGASV